MKLLIAILLTFSAMSAHASLTLETKFVAKLTMDGKRFSQIRVYATYNQRNTKDCKLKIGSEDLLSLFTEAKELNCVYIDSSNTILFEEEAIREIAKRSHSFSCLTSILKSKETCDDFGDAAEEGLINKTNNNDSIIAAVKNILGTASEIRSITTDSHSRFDLNRESNRITIDLTPVKTKIVID
jgi:hypothetical protein